MIEEDEVQIQEVQIQVKREENVSDVELNTTRICVQSGVGIAEGVEKRVI